MAANADAETSFDEPVPVHSRDIPAGGQALPRQRLSLSPRFPGHWVKQEYMPPR
ncbi:MAG: hypothetical protein R2912_03485 [Eubacteriales bacterium]